MTRKRYIKLVMSLLYGKNQAVEQAWYINSLMKTDKRVTYQGHGMCLMNMMAIIIKL